MDDITFTPYSKSRQPCAPASSTTTTTSAAETSTQTPAKPLLTRSCTLDSLPGTPRRNNGPYNNHHPPTSTIAGRFEVSDLESSPLPHSFSSTSRTIVGRFQVSDLDGSIDEPIDESIDESIDEHDTTNPHNDDEIDIIQLSSILNRKLKDMYNELKSLRIENKNLKEYIKQLQRK